MVVSGDEVDRINIYWGVGDDETPAEDDVLDEEEAQALFDKYSTDGVVDWDRFFADADQGNAT